MIKNIEAWEERGITDDKVLLYESRRKAIFDELAFKREMELREQEAYEKGLKLGIEEVIKRGIEQGKSKIAQKLLTDGHDIEYVATITGLSLEQLQELKVNLHSNNE